MIRKQAKILDRSPMADARLAAEFASVATYPDSDGRPMGENEWQVEWILRLKANLEALFHDRADVLICADMFWYPVEGDPRIVKAPDIMVAFGRPKHRRMSYRQWEEEGVAPQVVIEIISSRQRASERQDLLDFYQTYGVEEFYQLDPQTNLQEGWLRIGGELTPIDDMHGWTSPRLGLRFDRSGEEPRIWLPDNRPLATLVELVNAADKARRLAAKLRELGVDPEQI